MKRVNAPKQVRKIVMEARHQGKRVSLVPTMGALHEGHESLIKLASENSDFLVVSIFVNPKQFGPAEDFSSYPRDIERDHKIAGKLGCDLLFTPTERDIYSSRDLTRITVKYLSGLLCGLSRPRHFDGVVLIVAKLFNIVQPDVAVFGQKDAQQAVIIQRMTYDLDFPVKIKLGSTVREKDGLAVSSRNSYLTPDERKRAPALYRALRESRMKIEYGSRDVVELCEEIRMKLEKASFDVHYAEMVEGETLRRWNGDDGVVLLAAAGKLGNTRLIDNIALRINDKKVEETLLEFPQWSRYE